MMHSTDQNAMAVEGKQQDLMRDAARERLAGQLPPPQYKVVMARVLRFLFTTVGRLLILSGKNLQTRASNLSELLDSTTEAEASVELR